MNAWTVLVLAGLLEIVWSLALDRADGLARPGWAAVGILVAMTSLLMLSYSLRTLPLGTAYAVWVAIGTVGVAAVGILLLGEPARVGRIAALGLILLGVAWLHAADA